MRGNHLRADACDASLAALMQDILGAMFPRTGASTQCAEGTKKLSRADVGFLTDYSLVSSIRRFGVVFGTATFFMK